jgi:anti-sigma factor RsiW
MKYQEDEELRGVIQSQASRYDVPPVLREKILANIRSTGHAEKQHWITSILHWSQWRGLGAGFASGVVLSIVVTLYHGINVQQEQLADQVIDGHVRALMVAHLSDVVSTDQHTVKPWFNGKLDYSPPVLDFADEGFKLVGGRLDYLDERPVAALVYQHKLHIINVFVWPVRDKVSTGVGSIARQGFNVTSWQLGGMQYWAVSDLNAADLKRFAELLRNSPV